MKVIIDRFEGDFCICEDEKGKTFNIGRSRIPQGAREGDVLVIENDIPEIDVEETQKRRERIEKMAEELWE